MPEYNIKVQFEQKTLSFLCSEDQDIISNIYFTSQGNSKDFYNRNTNFSWNSSAELNKNFILKLY